MARTSGQVVYIGQATRQMDPFYGFQELATICARFVKHLFNCPDRPPLSTTDSSTTPSPPLANFMAYAIHRTRLSSTVIFAALYLLHRLKARFPACKGSSGHRLFLSAYMVASKVVCDDTYSNKSWVIVGQGIFALRDLNQMERELCSCLEWDLNLEPRALEEFEQKVRRDFIGLGPYPQYTVPCPPPGAVPSTTPYNMRLGVPAPVAALTARTQRPPSMSLDIPIPPPVPVHAGAPRQRASSSSSTPEMSNSPTSSASSASPVTPAGYVHGAYANRVARSCTNPNLAPPTTATHVPTYALYAQTSSHYQQTHGSLPKRRAGGDVYMRIEERTW